MEKKKSANVRDPRLKLQAALDVLEKFMQLNAAEPIPHIFHCHEEKSGLKKIIGLARQFIASALNENVRLSHDQERKKIEDEVMNAIDDVQRYHPLVLKNIAGGEALTVRALESINQFNQFGD